MEQFRQIGEALGSVKAWMVFQENIQINPRQCFLLVEMLSCTYEIIAEEMKHNLRLEEMKQMKWRMLEQPLKDLLRVFKEAEAYIKHFLERGDNNWWAKVVNQNTDCVQLHIHNLYCCIPVIIEAIENVAMGDVIGPDHHQQVGEEEMKRMVYTNKYLQKEWKDPKLFQWKFGKQYLVTPHLCTLLDAAWREDRWILINRLRDTGRRRRITSSTTKFDRKMADALLLNLVEEEPEEKEEESKSSSSWSECSNNKLLSSSWKWKKKNYKKKLLPSSLLVGSKDYQVRRRLGTGRQYKEVSWLGDNFALRHVTYSSGGGDEEVKDELVSAAAASHCCGLSHPNIMNTLCSFIDEEKRECFILMELMSRDLASHIKEMCGPRKRIVPFSLSVTVDIMLQIARGMEYLHSNNIYHGDLNPSNVLIKPRLWNSSEGYLHVKVTGFGAFKSYSSSIVKMKNSSSNPPKSTSAPPPPPPTTIETPSYIWHAPEVLTEQDDQMGMNSCSSSSSSKYSLDKCDVYSFGMICFELLTGKVPFEDTHLQGDKMSRNIRAGERPLFPFPSSNAKYLTNLTKRCWHTEPNQRPTFTSICRILRYVKRFLMMNPQSDHHPPPLPTTSSNNNSNSSSSSSSHTDQPMPSTDYCEVEARLAKLVFPSASSSSLSPSQNNNQNDIHVYDIPFQMFMYMAVEKEKTSANLLFIRDINNNSESGSEGTASICGDDTLSLVDDPLPPHHLPLPLPMGTSSTERKLSLSPENPSKNHLMLLKRSPDRLSRPKPAAAAAFAHKAGRSSIRPPHIISRSMRLISERDIPNPKMRRSASYSHASDSELP